ncbi:hypothetical protein GCM10018790_69480 [Kitasatospora xanthocidica]|nr:hypothetical protein GCM10018790_69480 [Kitasatospora xanthocidica]
MGWYSLGWCGADPAVRRSGARQPRNAKPAAVPDIRQGRACLPPAPGVIPLRAGSVRVAQVREGGQQVRVRPDAVGGHLAVGEHRQPRRGDVTDRGAVRSFRRTPSRPRGANRSKEFL